MGKIKCINCGYEWITASSMMWVTCPSCLSKTKNKKELKEKEKQ